MSMEEEGAQVIRIYGTHTCSDCRRSKAFLQNRNIAYKEYFIEDDDQALAYALSVNGDLMITPTIVFSDNSVLVEPDNEVLEKKVRELRLL